MTMMTTPPEHERFQALLSDYMSEPEDDGFSSTIENLMKMRQNTQANHQRLTRLRAGFLMGGCFMGGIIAASQIKAAWALLGESALPSGPLLIVPLLVIFAFAVWSSLDNRDAGTL